MKYTHKYWDQAKTFSQKSYTVRCNQNELIVFLPPSLANQSKLQVGLHECSRLFDWIWCMHLNAWHKRSSDAFDIPLHGRHIECTRIGWNVWLFKVSHTFIKVHVFDAQFYYHLSHSEWLLMFITLIIKSSFTVNFIEPTTIQILKCWYTVWVCMIACWYEKNFHRTGWQLILFVHTVQCDVLQIPQIISFKQSANHWTFSVMKVQRRFIKNELFH